MKEIKTDLEKVMFENKPIYTVPTEYDHSGIRIESVYVDSNELPKSMWNNAKNSARTVNIFCKLNGKVHISAKLVDLDD